VRQKESARQELEARLFDHQQDPIDPAWARDASERLRQTLTDGFDGGAPEVDIECRSSSCVAMLKYATFGEAAANVRRLTVLPQALNCALHAAVDEPSDERAGGTARVLYHDCVK
jgi:hypothetical protein